MLTPRCHHDTVVSMNGRPDMQDVRIRTVPVKLVRRLKSVLARRGESLVDWFLIEAAKTASEGEKR